MKCFHVDTWVTVKKGIMIKQAVRVCDYGYQCGDCQKEYSINSSNTNKFDRRKTKNEHEN
jgi:hypothetical protein